MKKIETYRQSVQNKGLPSSSLDRFSQGNIISTPNKQIPVKASIKEEARHGAPLNQKSKQVMRRVLQNEITKAEISLLS